jgi:pimeloyl-ACP methyl ester carboxylesterase
LLLLALLWFFVQLACAYHASKTAHTQVADAAPGQVFDIGGGVKMHMLCQGERANNTSPTIILESMEAVGQALAWSAVLEAMEEYDLRVCAYDRRGYGWSSPLPFASSEAQKRGIKETVCKMPFENVKM